MPARTQHGSSTGSRAGSAIPCRNMNSGSRPACEWVKPRVQLRSFRCRIVVYFIRLVLKNALRHKLAHDADVVGIVVAITAFGLLRTIIDAWYAGANASSSARLVTRSSVSLVFSLPLTYAQKIRQVAGVARRVLGQLVRRRLHQRAQFLSAVRDRSVHVSGDLSGIRASRRRSRRRSSPIARARSSAASSPTSTDGRSATRFRCAARSIPGTWTFNLRGIYDGSEQVDRRNADVLSLGLPERDRSRSAFRGARTRSACSSRNCRDPGFRRPRCRRRSTRRSRTRSPRRSPRPRRRSSSASCRCRRRSCSRSRRCRSS